MAIEEAEPTSMARQTVCGPICSLYGWRGNPHTCVTRRFMSVQPSEPKALVDGSASVKWVES